MNNIAVIMLIKHAGANLNDIKYKNRALILRLIATEPPLSRADLARKTGLTKTTSSKIVSDLMEEGIICERESVGYEASGAGRKPIFLDISDHSPCICGVWVCPNRCTVILADLKGNIFSQKSSDINSNISAVELQNTLFQLYDDTTRTCRRRIFAIGISSIGQIDMIRSTLVKSPRFSRIFNMPLADLFHQKTQLPVFIINDANAGALAEKVYGNGKLLENYIYLHIANGIGSGYILDNRIYNGDTGQNGEIGHTSINFSGSQCDCGNVGCLELYANLDNLNKRIKKIMEIHDTRTLLPKTQKYYSWSQIIDAANNDDFSAIAGLEDFCNYLSFALANAINLMDMNHILVGYDSETSGSILEDILVRKLDEKALVAKNRPIIVQKSMFRGNSPLIGSIALITDKIFRGHMII